MKEKKQSRLVGPIEFRLLVVPRYKEREKKFVTVIELQTVQEFSNFRYDIVVQDTVEDDVLYLNIRGLRAPQPIMPAVGPALFRKEYADLVRVRKIIVTKIDGEKNSFLVSISRKDVKVKRNPPEKFVELVPQKMSSQ